MSAKKQPTNKPTGVNKGIKEGIDPSEFKGRVICKKCGKDIEFTKGSTLHLKCPRCQSKVERDLKAENKEAEKIIKYDILRRAKKYSLQFGFVLTCIAIAYNIVGYLTEWFGMGPTHWWLGLMSIPIVLLSFAFTRITRLKSASKKYRFFAWLALILNIVAVLVIVITSVPYLSEKLTEAYEKINI